MTINLLPWRESLNARRKLLLFTVSGAGILSLFFTVLICWFLVSGMAATQGAQTKELQRKVARTNELGQQLDVSQISQDNEDGLLNQIQILAVGGSLSRVNDPVWLDWVRDGLVRQQVGLNAWLAVPGQLDIRLQINDQSVFSELAAQMDEFSWQMAGFNTSEEVMNVVIRASAMD